ncbi:MAG: sugar transferase, partial [Clostridia bacterium]|nr:sugar transferase [Clostridia bacterium]
MYKYVKRVIDFIMALILIILTSPVMLVVALLIIIQRDGPVLFRQERPGKDGKIFLLHKFRTMSTTTEKDGRKLSDMERMSKLGSFLRKTSLDELPQFFDIISGKMSFIGPRPLVKSYLELYTPEQMRRHEVLPGISGWAQINGRNSISWEEKFELDVYYV